MSKYMNLSAYSNLFSDRFLQSFSKLYLRSDRKNLSKRKKICTNSNIRIGS
ncbi:hypothetical protein wcw_0537 [Waddlia chondrophila WSU 86-1044]|uniref:Uncharacterized protein n=1 Tax=Waddlia chondrophila (strain ATCC VR-1470 / WSU 86-1044) TaxID=716544 RepID=D6YUU7_WADCW|nr:hypothetical protein wcw_0537 [Waddlia chondrophila WSU 86-1044]